MRSALAGIVLTTALTAQGSVVVGSKNFPESALLGELIAQVVEAETELRVERRFDLGGTQICWNSLTNGEIDVYAEYTGTAWAVILKEAGKITDPLRAFLHVSDRSRREHGVRWLSPFGFQNAYGIAMREDQAERLGIRRLSELAQHAGTLRAGFSIEFMEREDGYPGLRAAYGLDFAHARGLEHGLAYRAIADGELDVIDAYTTDGKLLRYGLRVLEDDRRFFPPYHAAPLAREALLDRHPEVEEALRELAFAITPEAMQRMNLAVEVDERAYADVAAEFLRSRGLQTVERAATGRLEQGLGMLTAQHLGLTVAAVLLAALLAIPLGIAMTSRPRLRSIGLGVAGILQTVPSLALLAFMIPLLGLGVDAAIAALLLYALLPIVRNTYTGIATVDPDLVDAARGMGMRPREVLRRVQIPLAMRTIMAGVRTAAVISIGVATLAAFVGAGGLGVPIVRGLYLDDTGMILTGAVPAAILAVVVDWVLGRVERSWFSVER